MCDCRANEAIDQGGIDPVWRGDHLLSAEHDFDGDHAQCPCQPKRKADEGDGVLGNGFAKVDKGAQPGDGCDVEQDHAHALRDEVAGEDVR